MSVEECQGLFVGAEWFNIQVSADGSIKPPSKTHNGDKLRVKSCYHLGSRLYSVVNMAKFYQCFVQFRVNSDYRNSGPQARCSHYNCIKWQHTHARQRTPCIHVRKACRWHVTLNRRAKRLAQKWSDNDNKERHLRV